MVCATRRPALPAVYDLEEPQNTPTADSADRWYVPRLVPIAARCAGWSHLSGAQLPATECCRRLFTEPFLNCILQEDRIVFQHVSMRYEEWYPLFTKVSRRLLIAVLLVAG
jgi:hypothetical protein